MMVSLNQPWLLLAHCTISASATLAVLGITEINWVFMAALPIFLVERYIPV